MQSGRIVGNWQPKEVKTRYPLLGYPDIIYSPVNTYVCAFGQPCACKMLCVPDLASIMWLALALAFRISNPTPLLDDRIEVWTSSLEYSELLLTLLV